MEEIKLKKNGNEMREEKDGYVYSLAYRQASSGTPHHIVVAVRTTIDGEEVVTTDAVFDPQIEKGGLTLEQAYEFVKDKVQERLREHRDNLPESGGRFVAQNKAEKARREKVEKVKPDNGVGIAR